MWKVGAGCANDGIEISLLLEDVLDELAHLPHPVEHALVVVHCPVVLVLHAPLQGRPLALEVLLVPALHLLSLQLLLLPHRLLRHSVLLSVLLLGLLPQHILRELLVVVIAPAQVFIVVPILGSPPHGFFVLPPDALAQLLLAEGLLCVVPPALLVCLLVVVVLLVVLVVVVLVVGVVVGVPVVAVGSLGWVRVRGVGLAPALVVVLAGCGFG